MNLLLLGAFAGGLSGAAGYLIAGKIHGKEKVDAIYPAYAAFLFVAMVIAFRFMPLEISL